MLKELHIQNLILVETACIAFEEGLNVLSGETGSGKSAIMEALGLVLGERADSSIVRHGAEKALVEARFELPSLPALSQLLEASGIDASDGELILRREITASGKSKAFINNQMAQAGLLRQIAKELVQFVGQHANHLLLSAEHHRLLVDQYGELQSLQKEFAQAWKSQLILQKALEDLTTNASQRVRQIEICQMEIEEIEEADLKEGEEEVIFAEYSLLSQSKELSEDALTILEAISGERGSALDVLGRHKAAFERLSRKDPKCAEWNELFQTAWMELQEVSFSLQRYLSSLEQDPQRVEMLSQRLALINRLKKKYGTSVEEIKVHLKQRKDDLFTLENSDNKIEELREELELSKTTLDRLAQDLTQKRIKAANLMQKEILEEIRSLNMPKADFKIHIEAQERSSFGDNKVEFYLAPNVGESMIPVRECASGGELSRLVLALHVVLAGKAHIPTLLFDEVDANIGGQTARIVGAKLKTISASHQVICITHFPQVAEQAHTHLQIAKKEVEGRTLTVIQLLEGAQRTQELDRMLGKTTSS